ncbi:hypothetical protein GE300_12010 [Rhodobacteraceae bacterium 2CG4]|uniref:MFS transporter n=1 Tax=Halovulum marinum TaxID=2662447 RepID=A0A6L5Z2W2_9RHOB|nr:hypothetical protein [Halovulum marinum]MSU90334.1 hypothetical protein [Halovulum marinum]
MLSLAGVLGHAATPLMVVADLAPRTGAAAAGMIFGLAAAMTGVLYLGLGAVQAQLGTAAGLALAFFGPLDAAAIALPAMAREGPHQPSPDAIDSLDRLCRCACASGAGLLR